MLFCRENCLRGILKDRHNGTDVDTLFYTNINSTTASYVLIAASVIGISLTIDLFVALAIVIEDMLCE